MLRSLPGATLILVGPLGLLWRGPARRPHLSPTFGATKTSHSALDLLSSGRNGVCADLLGWFIQAQVTSACDAVDGSHPAVR
jgi:hypothetical protein